MSRNLIINTAVVLAVAVAAVWVGTVVLRDDHGTVDGPVIAVEGWNAYPAAELSGELRLVDDCLLIDSAVVFWAEGTSWDAANEAVVFGDADPVPVGTRFSGGGGAYSSSNLDGLDGVDVDAVQECLHRTGSRTAVFAYASDSRGSAG